MEPHGEASETDQLFRSNRDQDYQSGGMPILSLNEAYKRAGGFGRFQAFTLLTTVLSIVGPGLLVSNLVFFETKPENYYCYYAQNTTL